MELRRRIAADEDELLFWLVSWLVAGVAGRHELASRVPGRSFRRLLFVRELELLERLNPEWAQRRHREIESIRAECPYDDAAEGWSQKADSQQPTANSQQPTANSQQLTANS